MSNKMFDCGHTRGPSKDFHNASKNAELHPSKSSTKGHNPAPQKHHSPANTEYPHGHGKKNK